VSQASLEFTVLLSFLFLVFVTMFIVLGVRMSHINRDKNIEALGQVKTIIMDEVWLGATVEDGYKRQFQLPREVNGLSLNISVENDTFLFLMLGNETDSAGLPSFAVGGFCFKGLGGPFYNLSVTRGADIVSLSSCYNCTWSYAECSNAEKLDFGASGTGCDVYNAWFPGFKDICCNGHCKCCDD
jgi:hypothetical protein